MASFSLQSKKWDVFISFRGKEVRYGFLTHLFEALRKKGINTFMDENLRKGEEITTALLETIQESYVSIVVFSESYADSPWCLDELVKIVECKERSGQVVLPVFHHVDPADVQELRGRFGNAFDMLKEDFLHKMERWRHALIEISSLSGWDSKNFKSESKLVGAIVDFVWKQLSHMPSYDPYDDKLIGIDSRVKKIESLLQINSANGWRTVGIWGMGGIGKTTLVDEVFCRIMAKFDSHCFVANVKEEIKNETPIVLRDKILGHLLGEKNLYIGTPRLHTSIRRRLQSKKVLIVFDDVDDPNLLKLLGGECDLYCVGSRIIVISRDRQVLKNICQTECIYEAEKLTDHEALLLFSLYAFKQKYPKKDYIKLSKMMIRYAQGNPLAIRVVGSNLCDKGTEEWESELERLDRIPDMKIQDVLKTSYDALEHDEKNLFLDIACFFKGELKGSTERILEAFGFFPKRGISRLIDKSLITISNNNELGMHDLLQQMGMKIVHEECKQPGGRSRLWNAEDISHVLTTETGTENVEGILLNVQEIGCMELSSKAFIKMCNLRLLKFYNSSNLTTERILFPNGLEYLPDQLRYIYWECFPLKSLPFKFWPMNLVEFHMPWSQLEQLWNRDIKPLGSLKIMDLRYSNSLIRIPDLSTVPNLVELNLMGCNSLVEIQSSVHYLRKLNKLNLEGCLSLFSLPSCLRLESLEYLNLGGCSNLKQCLEIPCDIREIFFDGTAIVHLPSSIGNCSRLVELPLGRCTRLVSLPRSICNLKSLVHLDISDSLGLNGLPDNLGDLESLRTFDASGSGIKALPSSINQLGKLEYLNCEGCGGLTKLPPLTGLSCLSIVNLSKCGILEIPESVGSLVSLEYLYLDGNNFESIPESITQLSVLRELHLRDCKRLRYIPELQSCLEDLYASNCTSLESASCSLLLSCELKFVNCNNLNRKIVQDVLERHQVGKNVELHIPGSEGPQQMRYQNSGSSLSFILDPHHFVIGFSFCAIVDPRVLLKFSYANLFTIKCMADFIDESGHSKEWSYHGPFYHPFMLNSEHVFLWYDAFDHKLPFNEASFQFYVQDTCRNYYCEGIIKCGVHPIYGGQKEKKKSRRRRR